MKKKDSRPLQFSRKNIIRNGHYQRTNVKTTKKLTKSNDKKNSETMKIKKKLVGDSCKRSVNNAIKLKKRLMFSLLLVPTLAETMHDHCENY